MIKLSNILPELEVRKGNKVLVVKHVDLEFEFNYDNHFYTTGTIPEVIKNFVENDIRDRLKETEETGGDVASEVQYYNKHGTIFYNKQRSLGGAFYSDLGPFYSFITHKHEKYIEESSFTTEEELIDISVFVFTAYWGKSYDYDVPIPKEYLKFLQ